MDTKLTADTVNTEALDAWLQDRPSPAAPGTFVRVGRLSPQDAEKLRRWVQTPGPWRRAYRAAIASFAARAGVVRYDMSRSVAISAGPAEVEFARLIQDVPLPHLGPGARREGRLGAEGTLWRACDAGVAVTVLVPYGASWVEWGDDVLGSVVTQLVEHELDAIMLADDAMASIARLARGPEHPRARSIALAVAEDLRAGSLRAGMEAASRALENAELDVDMHVRWVACALMTQLEIEQLAHRLDDPELDAVLAAAEAELTPFASALLLLDDDHYADLIRGYDIDPMSWWGLRERLDEEVPESLVHAALEDIAGR